MTLHPNQWRIYAEHYRLDLEEEVEKQREFAEYVMAFYNIDGVRAVQRARELQKRNADKNVGDIFAKQVEQLLGRSLNFEDIDHARKKVGADQPIYIPEDEPLTEKHPTMEEVDSMQIKPGTKPLQLDEGPRRFRAMHDSKEGKS